MASQAGVQTQLLNRRHPATLHGILGLLLFTESDISNEKGEGVAVGEGAVCPSNSPLILSLSDSVAKCRNMDKMKSGELFKYEVPVPAASGRTPWNQRPRSSECCAVPPQA